MNQTKTTVHAGKSNDIKPWKEFLLPNGLKLSLFDRSRRYFGDYHLVKLLVICTIPLTSELFTDEAELYEARCLLGREVVYRRTAEQMGVPSGETEEVLNRLAAHVEKNALPYLGLPWFPNKYVRAQLKRIGMTPGTGAGVSLFQP